jgi:hypothetical protein
MNKKLVDLAPYLVPLAAVGGRLIIVLLVALVGRMRWLLRGTARTTPHPIWPPLAPSWPYIPPAAPTHQARDATIDFSNSHGQR